MIVEVVELSLTRWVRFGHVQLGQRERERGEKTFQPEGITSKGLKHGGIRKNADSLAG